MLFFTFISYIHIQCNRLFRLFLFNRWFFERIQLLSKKTQGFPGDRRYDWELCRYVHNEKWILCEWYCRRRNVLNSVKVIFLPDILSHSYTHIYLWRFTHKRIQTGGFGLPELGVDSSLPQFVKKNNNNILTFRVWPPAWMRKKGKRKKRNPAQTRDPDYFKSVIFPFPLTYEACLVAARVYSSSENVWGPVQTPNVSWADPNSNFFKGRPKLCRPAVLIQKALFALRRKIELSVCKKICEYCSHLKMLFFVFATFFVSEVNEIFRITRNVWKLIEFTFSSSGAL